MPFRSVLQCGKHCIKWVFENAAKVLEIFLTSVCGCSINEVIVLIDSCAALQELILTENCLQVPHVLLLFLLLFFTLGIKDPEGFGKNIEIRNCRSDHYSGQSS